jgi:uncharacterized cupin superfamily protein
MNFKAINIANIAELSHQELISKSCGEKYSCSAVLSAIFGLADIFVTHEILAPGKKDSAPHYHTRKEEMIFVLTGNPTIYIDAESIQLSPGDFIGIKPTTELHYLENLTSSDVTLLKICSNPKDDVTNFESFNRNQGREEHEKQLCDQW